MPLPLARLAPAIHATAGVLSAFQTVASITNAGCTMPLPRAHACVWVGGGSGASNVRAPEQRTRAGTLHPGEKTLHATLSAFFACLNLALCPKARPALAPRSILERAVALLIACRALQHAVF